MIKSVLLSLVLPDTNMNERDEEISEMHQLAYTLNYEITDVIYQRKIKIDSSTYFGKGKIKEIINKISLLDISTIFINEELSPSHFKNILYNLILAQPYLPKCSILYFHQYL